MRSDSRSFVLAVAPGPARAMALAAFLVLSIPSLSSAALPFDLSCIFGGCAKAEAETTTEGEEAFSDTLGIGEDWEIENEDIVRVGEDVTVRANQIVNGDVVAIGGRVTVEGKVNGDVVSVGGGIDLRKGALVRGDAVCVGGTCSQEEGAVIQGQNVSVGVLPKAFMPLLSKGGGRDRDHRRDQPWEAIWWDFVFNLGFFFVGLLLCLAMPGRALTVRQTLKSQFWLSLVLGFAAIIGAIVSFILLCITCVGIVVAVPGLFVAAIMAVGAGAVAYAVLGEVILKRGAPDRQTWVINFVIGLGALFVLHSLGRILSGAGGAGELIGGFLRAVEMLASVLLFMLGTGALVQSKLGSKFPSGTDPSWVPAGQAGTSGDAAGAPPAPSS